MQTVIIIIQIIIIIALIMIWVVYMRRRVWAMNENVTNAKCQIGNQLYACYDALATLMHTKNDYLLSKDELLMEIIMNNQKRIDADRIPDDVIRQDLLINIVMQHLNKLAETTDDLRAKAEVMKCHESIVRYKTMMKTGFLIYNDSVTRLNRELRIFPTSFIAQMSGVKQKKYIEVVE